MNQFNEPRLKTFLTLKTSISTIKVSLLHGTLRCFSVSTMNAKTKNKKIIVCSA